jgi:tetratricopeptide (TPR) repeat protein
MAAAILAYFAQAGVSQSATRQTALSLEQQGRDQDAEAAWHVLLKTHPADAEAYAHLGLLEARQQHYKEAIPLYRKALSLGPQIPSVRLNLGLALFKSGDLKGAVLVFKPLLSTMPPSSPAAQQLRTLIGMGYYGQARFAEAAPYLKQAVDHDPQNVPLLLALAHSYLWSKQYKYVLDVYHQMLTLNPDSAEADMLAGEALDQMKDNAGAVKMFRAAIEANPREPDVHFGLGYLLWTQKQYPEAAQEFQAELKNDPNHAQSMLYLADAEIQMNQIPAARPLLEEVLKRNPELPLTYLDLGIVDSEAGRNEDALRELDKAEKLMPNDVNVHWRLGHLYKAMGKNEQAKIELKKASNLNKAVDDALYQKISKGNAHPHPSQESSEAPADKP